MPLMLEKTSQIQFRSFTFGLSPWCPVRCKMLWDSKRADCLERHLEALDNRLFFRLWAFWEGVLELLTESIGEFLPARCACH